MSREKPPTVKERREAADDVYAKVDHLNLALREAFSCGLRCELKVKKHGLISHLRIVDADITLPMEQK